MSGDKGGVPDGWEFPKFSTVTESVRNGYVGTATDEYREKGDFDAVPYVVGSCVRENQFDLKNLRYVSEKFHLDNQKSQLQEFDILTVQSGHLGTTAVVRGDFGKANCHAVIISRPIKSKLDSDFVAYYFNSPAGRKRLSDIFVGSSIPHINTKDLKEFKIPLPPLPEQRKIAAILSTWDDSLATLTSLLAAKRQQKRGLAEALLTGKKRLPGFAGEWEETHLGRHVFEVSQRNRNSTIERVLSVTNHSGFVLPEEQFSKRVASENISNYKVVRKGQFAYNPSRLNVGSLARLDSFSEGVVSPLYVVFNVMDSLNRNYLLYWLESPLAESKIKASVQGSVRDSVSFDALSSFPISLPPLPEQEAIASILSTLDAEIASLEALRAKVQEQKRGLMDELLTGRVRVKGEG